MPFDIAMLDEQLLRELDQYIDSFDDIEHNIIPILHFAQNKFSYLPPSLQFYIARRANLPSAKINGIVTFYSFFSEKPRGKYNVNVCMGTACFVKHAQRLLENLEKNLKLNPDGLSEDGLFSVESIRCIGACGIGPVVQINDKIYGHVTEDDIVQLLYKYRGEDDENQ
ncbi:MAG: NAD(P)H-dependent oxidoreductase subunit E [Tissierellia bacterium]|nr:NAD(P)H-dependent oxidoreductase subunit E [Tissierellia bacterium]